MGAVTIWSGDDSGSVVTVKPASTPAVAADEALVVALSPNNPVTTTAPAPVATSSGTTDSRVAATAGTNATSLKASAGNLYGFILSNTRASNCYIKFFDKASAPVPGTDTPKFTVLLPSLDTKVFHPTFPIHFSTGIAYDIVGGRADSDSSGVAVDQVHGEITWF